MIRTSEPVPELEKEWDELMHGGTLHVTPAYLHRLYVWSYSLGYDPDCTTLPYTELFMDALYSLLYEQYLNHDKELREHEGDPEYQLTLVWNECLVPNDVDLMRSLQKMPVWEELANRTSVRVSPYTLRFFTYSQLMALARIAYNNGVNDGIADSWRYICDEYGTTWLGTDTVDAVLCAMKYYVGVTEGERLAIIYAETMRTRPYLLHVDAVLHAMEPYAAQESFLREEVRRYKECTALTLRHKITVRHGLAAVEQLVECKHDKINYNPWEM